MKLCSNVCNRCHLACKILFKSEQICGCCCKMLRGSLILGHTVQPAVSVNGLQVAAVPATWQAHLSPSPPK